jgi:phosphoenolpyruvate carboxykinase (ATP)
VPDQLLVPARAWADAAAYHATASKLAAAFIANFKQFEAGVSQEVRDAGPR